MQGCHQGPERDIISLLHVGVERYKSFSTMVDIQGERVTQTLRVELSPRWAAITFNSIPTGATLMVGDDRAGVTPLTVDLLAGRHSIRMDLERFKPHSARVEVEAETPYTLPTVRLVPQDGRVALKSMPSGATVTVGGHYRGVTPVGLSLSPDRSQEIVVSRAGHDSASRTVRLTPGEVREMLIPLVAREGDVTVSAIPRDAQLFIDGEPRGSANQTLRLIAVPHRFEIRKEGYVPYDTTVTPQPGFPESIEVTLKTPEQIKAEATPRVIKSPGGDTLVLVDGGRIRMGAPRREPGRRANETTREVELTRPFYVATTEVSNRQYQEFDGEHVSGKVGPYNLEIGHHPVVRVSWEQAAQYCNWLSARESLPPAYVRMNGKLVGARPLTTGYRLPTESEWSLVARFPDGGEPLKYPWGSSLPIPPDSGNYADLSADEILSNSLSGYDDRFPTTAPVESFRPNSIGLFNLGGNVAEWIHDVYMIYPSGAGRVERDPTGPPNGELHVIRGSSWMDSSVSELRLSFRDYGRKGRPDVGFRVARYLE